MGEDTIGTHGMLVESDRIVHRLTTMPLTRIGPEVCEVVRSHCQSLVLLHDHEHVLPTPEPGFAGAMVAIVVRDLPAAVHPQAQEILTSLRRSLP